MEDGAMPSVIENCEACGGAIDVTDLPPFTEIVCPHCEAAMRARRMFNNFEVVALIGEGGMGSVFKAHDHTLGRMVALKVLRREMSAHDDERAKLEQEARITASVNHPHVVRLYSFGEADGQFYLAMELVEKGSLDDLMAMQTRVPEAQALEIGAQIAQGLEAASERGLIHRDVKPGNILFAGPHTTKIVDFGLACVLEEQAEARGEIWGTPYYIAPERLNYESEDFRSDIYSLGGTLFHAIAGRPPFEAASASLVALKQLKSQPVSLEAFAPDVAPETAYVINRMLEKNPDDRYPSYEELVEHLEFARAKVLENAGRPAAAQREVVQVESSPARLYAGLISAAAALLLLGAGLWLFLVSEAPGVKGFRESIAAAFGGSAVTPEEAGLAALRRGEYAAAAESFGRAADAAPASSEAGQWARFHLAVSALLDGERDAARKAWREIQQAGVFSDRREDADLANMFLDSANFGLREQAVSPSDLERYPAEGAGVLVYFVAGLNNQSLGAKAEAERLFARFLNVEPPPSVGQWGIYRDIAGRAAAL